MIDMLSKLRIEMDSETTDMMEASTDLSSRSRKDAKVQTLVPVQCRL